MPEQPQATTKTDYYYVQGRRVGLETSDAVFAVSFRSGHKAEDPALNLRSRRLLTEDAEPLTLIPQYNLHIFRAVDSQTSTLNSAGEPVQRSMREAVATLDREPTIEFAAMAVRRMNGEENLSFLTRRFLAGFKTNVTRGQIDELGRQTGATIVSKLGYVNNGYLLEAPEAQGERGPIAIANLYFESGLCEFAHPDFIERRQWRAVNTATLERSETPRVDVSERDIEFLDRQWHLRTAKVIDAWNITRGQASITIGLLDDGVDTGHDEFASKLGPQFDFQTHTADASPKVSDDKHGTACAGVAAAAGIKASGVAPMCRLMAVRTPTLLGVSDEADMFRWAADNGADVISCSWGPPDNAGPFSLVDNVRAAMRYCLTNGRGGKGIPIFFAAGNGNELVSDDGYASNPDVMAIAASSVRDTRSPYSDFGPEIFIAAPSSGDSAAGDPRIFTTDRRGAQGYNTGDVSVGDAAGNYTSRFGGTSSACPLVAGTAALILSVNPALTRNQVREILKSTADKVGGVAYDAQGHSNQFGYGRVNAFAAVQAAQPSGTTGNAPSITGPTTASASSPPTFSINLGNRRLYAVELASRRELLDPANSGQRNSSNHFGSWTQGLIATSTYQPPADVWAALAAGQEVFYLAHFADDNAWSNYVVSSSIANAKSIQIAASGGGGAGSATQSSVSAPSSIPQGQTPQFQIQLGSRQLYAVELATRPELLDAANRDQQTASNHYGSWVEGLRADSPYLPPASVWSALAASGRVYYLGHFADDNAWSNYTVFGDVQNPPSINIEGASVQPSEGSPKEVRFPSGAVFQSVSQPQDSIDYSDSVANGMVPLIDTRGRESEMLSTTFKLSELMARGARYARIAPNLVATLQAIRDRLGKPLKVISGYRHPALNQALGGDENSEHMSGRAAAISGTTSALQPIDIARAALESVSDNIGIGLGPSSVYIDVAGAFYTFVYDGASMNDEQFAAWARGIRNQSRTERSDNGLVEVSKRSRPTIDAPIQMARSGSEPVFRITTGANRFFAVEVATQANLLRAEAKDKRNSQTFYASWEDPQVGLLEAQPGVPTIFALSADAWKQLRQASMLYYRVLSISQASPAWPDLMTSTPDDQSEEVPRIRIVEQISPRLASKDGEPASSSFLTSHAVDDQKWDRPSYL